MRELSSSQVIRKSIMDLGLDPHTTRMRSDTVYAALLRRSGSFLCPCTQRMLVDAVISVLNGLISDNGSLRTEINMVLEAMTAYGDFIEQKEFDDQTTHTGVYLYAAPPAFISRRSGAVLILGINQDEIPLLPDKITNKIEQSSHIRKIGPNENEDLISKLIQYGLIELSIDYWLRSPQPIQANKLVEHVQDILGKQSESGEVQGLELLDPARDVKYYKGRWVDKKNQTGFYVARRVQAFGAKIWCYVEMQDGSPLRFVDFPFKGSEWRGCDDAWYLQFAIDAFQGRPQVYKIKRGVDEGYIDFFSPLPSWAQRRMDALGELVHNRGSLLSYRLPMAEIDEEIAFIKEILWMVDANVE